MKRSIIIAALLAAVAAKVLIPALIALSLLGAGFAGGYYYHLHVIAQHEQAIMMELMRFRQEATRRHTVIQQSANNLAQRTENNIELVIRRNHTQHIHIEPCLGAVDDEK